MYLYWWRGTVPALVVLCVVTFAAGGTTGWLINTRGGGAVRGMLLFGGTYLLSFLVSQSSGLLVFFSSGPTLHFTIRAFVLGSMASLLRGRRSGATSRSTGIRIADLAAPGREKGLARSRVVDYLRRVASVMRA
jgi:hypothetical protein